MISAKIRARARKVKLLLMDVDGVLTDGRIYYLINPRGGFYETKTFHSRDGLGIRLAHQAGLKTGILSGRSTSSLRRRKNFRSMGMPVTAAQRPAPNSPTTWRRSTAISEPTTTPR